MIKDDIATCDNCGRSQPFNLCIDLWGTHEEKDLCFRCQKELKVIWFDPARKQKKK